MLTSASSTASSPGSFSTPPWMPAAVKTLDRVWLGATLLARRFPSAPATAPARPRNSSAKTSSFTSIPAWVAGEHGQRLAIHLENAWTDRRHLQRAELGKDARGGSAALLHQLEVLDGGRAQADLLSLEGREGLGGSQPF